jgi:hypothetical protein
MIRSTLLVVAMVASAAASAKQVSLSTVMAKKVAQIVYSRHAAPMVAFKVGDTDNYSLSVAGMQGTMVMKVTDVQPAALTIDQNMNIMGQTQDAVEVINPNTGDVISITVNGQKQTPPDPSDDEITAETPTSVTVPAGTFNCEEVTIHTKSSNTETQQWVDVGGTVPVGGMLKMTTTQQGMPIEADLTSFAHGN